MIDININVKCPDLALAASAIAAALNHKTPANCQTFGNLAPVQTAASVQPAPTVAPINPAAAQATAGTAPAAPAPVPPQTPPVARTPAAPQVPTSPAPGYTKEQIGKAGADMIAANPAKMTELLALLQQFDALAVTELKPEQLGAFATALRGLGAKI